MNTLCHLIFDVISCCLKLRFR